MTSWLAVPWYPAPVLTPAHSSCGAQTTGSLFFFGFTTQHDNSKTAQRPDGPADPCSIVLVTTCSNIILMVRGFLMWSLIVYRLILTCTRFASGCRIGELEPFDTVRVHAHISTHALVGANLPSGPLPSLLVGAFYGLVEH